jgi:alkylation response protein AidB-like acyl-CoA dehydrogenase
MPLSTRIVSPLRYGLVTHSMTVKASSSADPSRAIKHKCADVLLAVETARSAPYWAARCAASLSDELPSIASLAKAYCSGAYVKAASENIQIYGGIGFTWEHPAHLYLKRARSAQSMLGTSVYHRERLADRIGI